MNRKWWAGLRVVVGVSWAVALAVNLWTAPRQASYDEARAAVTGKRLDGTMVNVGAPLR